MYRTPTLNGHRRNASLYLLTSRSSSSGTPKRIDRPGMCRLRSASRRLPIAMPTSRELHSKTTAMKFIALVKKRSILLLSLLVLWNPISAFAEAKWTSSVLEEIRQRQYQETLNDPFIREGASVLVETGSITPSSCVQHPIACVFDFYEKRGLFESTVGFYKRSENPVDGYLNKITQFTDANVFVTLTSLIYLMDANQYLGADISDLIAPAVDAIRDFHDRNNPGASLLGFWEQSLVNNAWVTYAVNEQRIAEDINGAETTLRDACELIFSTRECEDHFPGFPNSDGSETFLPPDTDDTSENLSVGALLSELQSNPAYRAAYQEWRDANSDAKIKSALAQIMHYAYDASGESIATNLIDPRTYYFLSGFYQSGSAPSTRIPTTWLLDDEQVIANHYRGRGRWPTPHLSLNNVNDIDPIELGHFVTAVARLDRSGLLMEAMAGDERFAEELGKLAHDSVLYLVYLISHNVPYLRPDILAPYYAYPEQLYEALASFLAVTQGRTPKLPQLSAAAQLARDTMKRVGTDQLIAHHLQGDGRRGTPSVYWEGKLKNREITGVEVVRDRAFATSVAVSALLDIWTVSAADGTLVWHEDVDASVRDTLVPQAITFIKKAALDPSQPLTAIAFVGSNSIQTSEIYRYPANYYAYLDGERIIAKDCVVNECETAVYGVLGHIPRHAYLQLVAKGPFDFGPTPAKSVDWGTSGESARIWRSEAQAYGLALKVVAQFERIRDASQ